MGIRAGLQEQAWAWQSRTASWKPTEVASGLKMVPKGAAPDSRWRCPPMMMTNMPEKQRILIVDDERQITRVLSRGLTTKGYDVHIAADGEEALQTFSDWH